MSFFGLTMLGGGEIFKKYTPVQTLQLASIPDEKYVEAFDANTLGDTSLASDCQVDGNEHILRGDLHLILFHVLDRSPHAEELDIFLTFVDTDTSAVISRREFVRSLQRMKERCTNPQAPKIYTSHIRYVDDMTRHRRVEYEPMTTLRRPITHAQEVGWHTMAGDPNGIKRHPLNTTDVTRNEGVQPSNYFGSCH